MSRLTWKQTLAWVLTIPKPLSSVACLWAAGNMLLMHMLHPVLLAFQSIFCRVSIELVYIVPLGF